ncbi:MAG: hypothetical protein WBK54_06390 [Bacilli bacterium]|jgi:hypothetical protein|nr:hypothetical protein [Acholeplasmataceae bacterium]
MKGERILFQYDVKKEAGQFLYWAVSCHLLSAIFLALFLAMPKLKIMILPVCLFFIIGFWFLLMYLFGRNYRIRVTKTEFIFTAIFKTKRYKLSELRKYECKSLRNKWYVFEIFFGNETVKPVTRNKRDLKRILNYFLNNH